MTNINYEAEVKKVYPKPYEAFNSLFETWCLYEDHTMTNRLSERCKRGYEIWQSAYKTLKQQGKL